MLIILPLLSTQLFLTHVSVTGCNLVRVSYQLVHERCDFEIPLLLDCILLLALFESVGDIHFEELWQYSVDNL